MRRALLVDLGGSSLKAGVFDLNGTLIATERVANVFIEDEINKSEQQPDGWWTALQTVADRLDKHIPDGLAGIEAVVLCGFTRTQVFLNDDGLPVCPAITFRDSRAQGVVEDVLLRPGVADHPLVRHFNAFHPLARILWLKHNEPAVWEKTKWVVEPKDYLNFKLTGALASDPISQFWLRSAMEGGENALTALAGLDRSLLPELRRPHEAVGTVLKHMPGALGRIAGASVFCGCNDTWTAAAGLGALKNAMAYCISGSSEVFGILSDAQAEVPGLITMPWADTLWQLGGPGLNGANVLTWMVNSLMPDERPFDERLAALLSQQTGLPLLFHPYLHGERTPLWDRDIRASFMGLMASHKPGDLVRGAMEGVSFVNRMVLERAEAGAGQEVQEIRLGGGGARNADWNQIRANILKRPVIVSEAEEVGLMGCLAVARFGLSLVSSIAQATEGISAPWRRFEPQAAESRFYDELYAIFLDTLEPVRTASHRLASCRLPGT
ncbi:xylulokinase [Allorhizobium terrae]|uniref:Carbohydrate kinase n=1 Tax=Allorhizobium terrae TaxID=1848972 RepID=A0A4S3ZU85_9HYPH|nr:FGGY-family carbohydrate kinase [Allorhizobium terrae]THF49288.1 carbohydrate kinase [Allorhizobium terrae]